MFPLSFFPRNGLLPNRSWFVSGIIKACLEVIGYCELEDEGRDCGGRILGLVVPEPLTSRAGAMVHNFCADRGPEDRLVFAADLSWLRMETEVTCIG